MQRVKQKNNVDLENSWNRKKWFQTGNEFSNNVVTLV